MKKITLSQFKDLVARNDWHREQEIEEGHKYTSQFFTTVDEENPELITTKEVCGVASKTSTLDGITIRYNETYSYEECESDTFNASTEGQDVIFEIDGVVVVDDEDDEEEIDVDDLSYYLKSDFRDIDYSKIVENIDKVTEVDVCDEDDSCDEDEMKTYTLEVQNAPNIKFTGKRIGCVDSSSQRSNGRWTELDLYKTKSGKFVCHQVGRTLYSNEHDVCTGEVCETIEEVINFFGHGWLAKELYYDADIEDVVEVD